MSKGTAYRCDGPACDVVAPAEGTMGILPAGWWGVRHNAPKEIEEHHFHSIGCMQAWVAVLTPASVSAQSESRGLMRLWKGGSAG